MAGDAPDRLLAIYDNLLSTYGAQYWWPGDSDFEIMVGAVLTQATAWTNVEKAISNLRAANALTPHAIRVLRQDELAKLIYPSGYYNAKARKLGALAQYLGDRFADDLDAMAREDLDGLRSELLNVHGIGEETADDILLYVAGQASFVVDAYTRRVFWRLGLAPEKGSYGQYRAVFMEHLPRDAEMFGEYHALIVRHGREVCTKAPACEGCCLLELCPTGQTRIGSP